jgi:hypothetical protein
MLLLPGWRLVPRGGIGAVGLGCPGGRVLTRGAPGPCVRACVDGTWKNLELGITGHAGPHREPCASPTVRSRGAHTRRCRAKHQLGPARWPHKGPKHLSSRSGAAPPRAPAPHYACATWMRAWMHRWREGDIAQYEVECRPRKVLTPHAFVAAPSVQSQITGPQCYPEVSRQASSVTSQALEQPAHCDTTCPLRSSPGTRD